MMHQEQVLINNVENKHHPQSKQATIGYEYPVSEDLKHSHSVQLLSSMFYCTIGLLSNYKVPVILCHYCMLLVLVMDCYAGSTFDYKHLIDSIILS